MFDVILGGVIFNFLGYFLRVLLEVFFMFFIFGRGVIYVFIFLYLLKEVVNKVECIFLKEKKRKKKRGKVECIIVF